MFLKLVPTPRKNSRLEGQSVTILAGLHRPLPAFGVGTASVIPGSHTGVSRLSTRREPLPPCAKSGALFQRSLR